MLFGTLASDFSGSIQLPELAREQSRAVQGGV
jgi:hypothetical protein